MLVKMKLYGKVRAVGCRDHECPDRPCFKPHDCPIQGAGGVRESAERWMCLTNVNHGCPAVIPEPVKKRKVFSHD